MESGVNKLSGWSESRRKIGGGAFVALNNPALGRREIWPNYTVGEEEMAVNVRTL